MSSLRGLKKKREIKRERLIVILKQILNYYIPGNLTASKFYELNKDDMTLFLFSAGVDIFETMALTSTRTFFFFQK